MGFEPKPSCCNVNRGMVNTNSEPNESNERFVQANYNRPKDMILIPGGTFMMGTDDLDGFPADGEGPVRIREISPFYMDVCTVTNSQFTDFVEDTRYRTEAERFGWTFVFHLFVSEKIKQEDSRSVPGAPWWLAVNKAYWKNPEGINSTIDDRMDHPVIHISWNDAVAYCKWAGKRLPLKRNGNMRHEAVWYRKGTLGVIY
jgi:formylglycine-generating enzyme